MKTPAADWSSFISATLAQHDVVTIKQLSYLANTTADLARGAIQGYFEKHGATESANLYPIFLVSGLRIVHGQYALVFLITSSLQLELTKRKFVQVNGVQYYGLAKSVTALTPAALDSLLTLAAQLTTQLEAPQLVQHPLSEPNALRLNAHSSVVNDAVVRTVKNQVATTIKAAPLITPSVFEETPQAPNMTPAAPVISAKTSTANNNTIVHKQSKLQFGVTKKGNSAFDDFDDQVIESTPKVNPFASSNTSQSKPTKRSAPTSAAALISSIDNDDDDDDVMCEAPVVKPANQGFFQQQQATVSESSVKSNAKAKKGLFDEFDDNDDFLPMVKPSKRNANNHADKASSALGKMAPGPKANFVIEEEESDDGEALMASLNTYSDSVKQNTTASRALLVDDGGDDEMVASSKGVVPASKKGQEKKRVIIDDDSQSDKDDEYTRVATKNTNADERHSAYQEMSKQEYAHYLKEEDEAKKVEQRAKEALVVSNAREALLKATTIKATTRVDEKTGKLQKLVQTTKMVTSIDEDGFEVKKKQMVEEWVEMNANVEQGAYGGAKPSPAAATTASAIAKKTPPAPAATKAEPPKGGIMSFFSKK